MVLHLPGERAPSRLDRYLPEPSGERALPIEYLLAVLRLALGWHFLALGLAGLGTFGSAALLVVGAALLLGVLMRVAAAGGVALVAVHGGLHAWPAALASFDPLILVVLLVLLAASAAGDTCGLGRIWADTPVVRRLPWLA